MNETQTAAVHPLEEMGISREVVQAFDWMGFQNLTAIQQKCIPLMMDGHDIIAIAPTGTGKTLGFGIPMLEYVNLDDSNIQEVVLAPTRELAQQIADELTHLAHFIKGLKIAVIYGGQPFGKQMSALSRKPQVLVATPGRLLDHMQRGNIRLGTVHTMVLDEADEMLNIAGIEASFVLFPEAGQAYLSARSGSNVNVQVISEMLGGGGNATTAGAQFPGKTTEDVLPLLKETIDNYFDDEA